MPEYLSPGVCVEGVDAGPKPIEGVSTSTTAAEGVTEGGPSGSVVPGETANRAKSVLVTSFAEFTRIFGGFLPEPLSTTVDFWALDSSEVTVGGCFRSRSKDFSITAGSGYT
jgi:phage tail sheath protein FI